MIQILRQLPFCSRLLGRYLLGLAGAWFALAAYAEEVVIATGEWPPYVSASQPQNGMMAELVRAALAESGTTVRFQFMSWPRVEAMVLAGQAFAGMPYVLTDERAERFDFSDSVLATYPTLFYLRQAFPNGFDGSRISALQGYRVATARGTWFEPEFSRVGIKIIPTISDEQAISLVYLDRADVTITDRHIGQFLIDKLYPNDRARFSASPFGVKPSVRNHLIVSRRYPGAAALLTRFNQGLARIRQNGRYDAIVRQHDGGEGSPYSSDSTR